MYEEFFGLRESPFNLTPDPRFLFLSPKHEEALSNILYGINEKKGFILLTGEIGTGKTTLCRKLLHSFDSTVRSALILNPNLTTIEILQAINQDFGIPLQDGLKKRLIDDLNTFLLDAHSEDKNVVLIIDEAQDLSPDALEQIRLLSNLETEKEKLLQIVLVGQPELNEKLKTPQLKQLNQRIAVRYHLQPLNKKETEEYINRRIQIAGGDFSFPKQSVKKIYKFSGGVPRLINLVCDRALLAAYASSKRLRNKLIEEAIAELQGKKITYRDRVGLRPILAVPVIIILLTAALTFKENINIDISGIEKFYYKTTAFVSSILNKEEGKGKQDQAEKMTIIEGFDKDGIFRVNKEEDSPKAVVFTLLKQWDIKISDLMPLWKKPIDNPLSAADRFGFGSYTFPLSMERLKKIDLPCIIELIDDKENFHPVVAAAIRSDDVVIFDPLYGKKQYKKDELEKRWSGKGITLWSKIDGIELPFEPKEGTQSVKKLQELLKKAGYFPYEPTGTRIQRTIRALNEFQKANGIKEDGYLGPETIVFLSRINSNKKMPRLTRVE
ncbi:MAG: AAA family ATPase [Nitrospirota bacterium]